MAGQPTTHPPIGPRAIFAVAVWFALLAGLLEGLTKWGIPVLGLAGSTRFCIGDLKVLWAPVVVDLAFFLTLAMGMVVLSRLLPRLPWLVIATGGFATLLFYGLLAVTGLLRYPFVLALGLGMVVSRWMRGAPEQRLAFLRRTLLPLVAVTLVLTLGPWPGAWLQERIALARAPEPPAGAPNVLLIVLDTARADRMGAYGYPRPTTPFLDEFALQGVLFENAIANSSWTLPSHVSLLTGRLPHEHQAEVRGSHYDGRFPTLAGVLSGSGYATAAVAANHGFASCATGVITDFLHCEDAPSLFEQATDVFYLAQLRFPGILHRLGIHELPREWIAAPEVNRRFLRWLDNRPNRPFFVFLNYNDLHFPYQPPLEYRRRFSDDLRAVRLQEWFQMRETAENIDTSVLKRASDHYDASLAYLDFHLRALFEELERRQLMQDLVVIITSDHGESLGEHQLLEHQIALYRQQIHVPLLIRWPAGVPRAMRIAQAVGLNQIPATISALLGVSQSHFSDPSLETYWKGPNTAAEDVVSELAGGRWEGVPAHWPIHYGRLRSLVSERWHLLLRGDGVAELYDWIADPREEHNLASDPAHLDIVTALRRRLESATQVEK